MLLDKWCYSNKHTLSQRRIALARWCSYTGSTQQSYDKHEFGPKHKFGPKHNQYIRHDAKQSKDRYLCSISHMFPSSLSRNQIYKLRR